MENKVYSNKQNPRVEGAGSKKGLEIRNNKIMPHYERKNTRRFARESEWEQEYYIIYNSYVLDEERSDKE